MTITLVQAMAQNWSDHGLVLVAEVNRLQGIEAEYKFFREASSDALESTRYDRDVLRDAFEEQSRQLSLWQGMWKVEREHVTEACDWRDAEAIRADKAELAAGNARLRVEELEGQLQPLSEDRDDRPDVIFSRGFRAGAAETEERLWVELELVIAERDTARAALDQAATRLSGSQAQVSATFARSARLEADVLRSGDEIARLAVDNVRLTNERDAAREEVAVFTDAFQQVKESQTELRFQLKHFQAREPMVHDLLKACEIFDEYDGDRIPPHRKIWDISSAWGDLAVWSFNNQTSTALDATDKNETSATPIQRIAWDGTAKEFWDCVERVRRLEDVEGHQAVLCEVLSIAQSAGASFPAPLVRELLTIILDSTSLSTNVVSIVDVAKRLRKAEVKS